VAEKGDGMLGWVVSASVLATKVDVGCVCIAMQAVERVTLAHH